jgi:hypothetical protein
VNAERQGSVVKIRSMAETKALPKRMLEGDESMISGTPRELTLVHTAVKNIHF